MRWERSEAIWLFVYGSLMWDGWETFQGCTNRTIATLTGFSRSFDKPSQKRWGSARNPCPTLSLVKAPKARCHGVAFEFPDALRPQLLETLRKREGKGFEFPDRTIQLAEGTEVMATIPMLKETARRLDGSNGKRAALVTHASGDAGNCHEYVAGIVKKLAELGIEDQAVHEFWQAVSLQGQIL